MISVYLLLDFAQSLSRTRVKHTDKGEDDAEQPENPVKDWNPAENEADEGENKTGGANTI